MEWSGAERGGRDICHVMDCNGSDIFISLMDDSARNEAQDGWLKWAGEAVGGCQGGWLQERGQGSKGSWPNQAQNEKHATGSWKRSGTNKLWRIFIFFQDGSRF